ncbi:STAS domain-containing protein [Nonomuraea sediminis]|uniref:STAS domain-containing protein n=1 Tax=Nonomuraea sediminis TaxID=2835864 RepID=UPI001BDC8606|nr:STAS domain-containing protein [Nonomuraea sediminis]
MTTSHDHPGLRARVSSRPGGVLSISGELDLATAQALRDIVHDALARHKTTLVLDLSGVRFCDVIGLGVLRACAADAESSGGRLELIGIPEQLRRVMEISEAASRSPSPGA